MVTAVKADASAPGTKLLRAGAIAFAAVLLSWLVFAGVNGALNEVDLAVYRDGGLIVRHVQPFYDPGAYAPSLDLRDRARADGRQRRRRRRVARGAVGGVTVVLALVAAGIAYADHQLSNVHRIRVESVGDGPRPAGPA